MYWTPALALMRESFAIPSFSAILSAVMKPMPKTSSASLYGFSRTTWTASLPYCLNIFTA